MRTLLLTAVGLTVLAAAPAQAADRWQADTQTCIGVYGALADQAQPLADWSAALKRSNLTQIDWAARKATLVANDEYDIYAAAAEPYETGFKMGFLRDRIVGTAKNTSDALELSQACDKANGFSPSLTVSGS